MIFIQKILDMLKLDSTRKMEEEQKEEILQKEEPIQSPEKLKTPKNQKRNTLDVERYAVMCNAYLDHQEEMAQYYNIVQQKINEETTKPESQTIYFKNGRMYKVYPTDKESWYDARYLVTDGKTYDLENIDDIQKIPIPNFPAINDDNYDMMNGYGITGSLDYVIEMKAGNARRKGLIEESNELYKKAIVLMKHSGIPYPLSKYLYLAKELFREGKFEQAEKAELDICEYITGERYITDYITQNEREYYRIKYILPEIAPKSLSGYTRMKNSKSENFMKIVNAAKEKGIIIVLD